MSVVSSPWLINHSEMFFFARLKSPDLHTTLTHTHTHTNPHTYIHTRNDTPLANFPSWRRQRDFSHILLSGNVSGFIAVRQNQTVSHKLDRCDNLSAPCHGEGEGCDKGVIGRAGSDHPERGPEWLPLQRHCAGGWQSENSGWHWCVTSRGMGCVSECVCVGRGGGVLGGFGGTDEAAPSPRILLNCHLPHCDCGDASVTQREGSAVPASSLRLLD